MKIDPQEMMPDEVLDLLHQDADSFADTVTALLALKECRDPGERRRGVALARTKVQEALFWATYAAKS